MRPVIAMGAAIAALTVTAAAHTAPSHRVELRHHPDFAVDADEDGWVTRAEAAAAAQSIFDEMDSDGDGRLTSEDRARHISSVEVEVLAGGDDRRVRIIERDGEDVEERIEREIERAEIARELAELEAERTERHVERVIIVHNGADASVAPTPPAPPASPVAPRAPRAPMFMMLIANSEEADLDGDGALSRDEFVAQHLRFFDASDANGDGRVRYRRPPAPPSAPTPPAPPEPPRRR